MVGPWILFLRVDQTMNAIVIMVGPWMLFPEWIRPWVSSWFGHECPLLRTDQAIVVRHHDWADEVHETQ